MAECDGVPTYIQIVIPKLAISGQQPARLVAS